MLKLKIFAMQQLSLHFAAEQLPEEFTQLDIDWMAVCVAVC